MCPDCSFEYRIRISDVMLFEVASDVVEVVSCKCCRWTLWGLDRAVVECGHVCEMGNSSPYVVSTVSSTGAVHGGSPGRCGNATACEGGGPLNISM